jgi:hypothetical protein
VSASTTTRSLPREAAVLSSLTATAGQSCSHPRLAGDPSTSTCCVVHRKTCRSRCLPWSQSPAAGKRSSNGPLVDGACQIVTPDPYIVPGSTFTREQGVGGIAQPWYVSALLPLNASVTCVPIVASRRCYISSTTDPACPFMTEVFKGVLWQWVPCIDAGAVHSIMPYFASNSAFKRCFLFRKHITHRGSALTTTERQHVVSELPAACLPGFRDNVSV